MPYLQVFAIGRVLDQADLVDDGTARSFESEGVLDGDVERASRAIVGEVRLIKDPTNREDM